MKNFCLVLQDCRMNFYVIFGLVCMTFKWKENSCFQLSQVTMNNSYACVDMFVRLLYMYRLHTRKNNSYVIINGCLSFYLNCCTLSFPLNRYVYVLAVSPLINIKLVY